MAKFLFRFERVLKVKQLKEQERQRELAQAARRAEATLRSLDALNRRIREQQSDWRSRVQGDVDAWRLQLSAAFLEHLRQERRETESQLADALQEVEARRSHLLDALKERKIFEALKEREHQSFRRAQARLEQRLTDEAAEIAAGRKRRAAGGASSA